MHRSPYAPIVSSFPAPDPPGTARDLLIDLARADQHPAGAGSPVLSLSVDARGRHYRVRRRTASRGRKECHRQRRIFSGPLPRAPRSCRRVLMLESLSQVAAVLLVAARRGRRRTRASTCAASTTPNFASRSCRATGCASRSRSAGAAPTMARAQATAYLDDQVVAECELLLGVVPDRHRDRPDGDRASVRADRPGTIDRRRTPASART